MNDLPIIIKRLGAARNLRVRVRENGDIVVTAPRRLPDFYISDFIEQHRDWIIEKHRAATQNQQHLTSRRETLFFRGREYQFRLSISHEKSGVVIEDNKITATAPSENHVVVRGILEKFYRKEAEKRFKARLPLLADLVGKEVKTVSIRSQRTRWGSCSSRLTVSLNWRLIMAPDFASDYVIYHELAHLTHMNHSARFWSLVEEYFPNYKEAERWLKQHHKLLNF